MSRNITDTGNNSSVGKNHLGRQSSWRTWRPYRQAFISSMFGQKPAVRSCFKISLSNS